MGQIFSCFPYYTSPQINSSLGRFMWSLGSSSWIPNLSSFAGYSAFFDNNTIIVSGPPFLHSFHPCSHYPSHLSVNSHSGQFQSCILMHGVSQDLILQPSLIPVILMLQSNPNPLFNSCMVAGSIPPSQPVLPLNLAPSKFHLCIQRPSKILLSGGCSRRPHQTRNQLLQDIMLNFHMVLNGISTR